MPDSWMLLNARMILKLVASLVVVALVQPASAVQIRRVITDSGIVLRLRGDVTAGDYRRLKMVLQNGSVVGLEIRSGGGFLEEGLDIARVVRERGLVVYVSKECDSVCAFIFFAAKERYIGRRCKIGVHSVSNDRGKEDGDSARVTVRMSRLLVGLGVPHSIIGKFVTTPPAKITYLDNRDLAGLNVHRTNPFRNIRDATSLARGREASSVCNPGVDPKTDATAHVGDRSCTQAPGAGLRRAVTKESR
jgi:ATP-dependent protease ClpP protease subunit